MRKQELDGRRMAHPAGSEGLQVGPKAELARLIVKKHQPFWLSNQKDGSGLDGGGGFVGSEVECKGVIMLGVGPVGSETLEVCETSKVWTAGVGPDG